MWQELSRYDIAMGYPERPNEVGEVVLNTPCMSECAFREKNIPKAPPLLASLDAALARFQST